MPRRSDDRLLEDIGRRVAEERVARELTQEQLAEKLDVGPRYLQSVEAGRENLTVRTLATIARALRVEVADLFIAPTTPKPRPGRPKRDAGPSSPKRR